MFNRVILMGRLTADPELRQTQSGVATCKICIAVDRGYAKQGEEKQTDFFNITCWRQTAEFVSRYFSKGRMIHVEGKLQNNNYTDQNGVKHYSMDVVADNVTFCGDKGNRQQSGYQQTGYQPQNQPYQQSQNAPYTAPPQTYTPNPQTVYSGMQSPPQQYQQSAPAPQYQQPTTPQQYQQRPQQQQVQLGDLSQYELLADGDVPF